MVLFAVSVIVGMYREATVSGVLRWQLRQRSFAFARRR